MSEQFECGCRPDVSCMEHAHLNNTAFIEIVPGHYCTRERWPSLVREVTGVNITRDDDEAAGRE